MKRLSKSEKLKINKAVKAAIAKAFHTATNSHYFYKPFEYLTTDTIDILVANHTELTSADDEDDTEGRWDYTQCAIHAIFEKSLAILSGKKV